MLSLYWRGGEDAILQWPRDSIPLAVTACSVSRYTSLTANTYYVQPSTNVLTCKGSPQYANFFLGHKTEQRGMVHIGYNPLTPDGSVGQIDDWLIVCATSAGSTPYRVFIDQESRGDSYSEAQYVQVKCALNINTYQHSRSEFGIHSVYIWEGALSGVQMKQVTAAMRGQLGGVPDFEDDAVDPSFTTETAYCESCAPGSWIDGGSGDCTPCPAGTASAEVGATSQTTCVSCAVGTYNYIPGTSVCTPCAAGTYGGVSPDEEHNTCTECPAYTRSDAGSNSIDKCTCMTGYTGQDGAECTACNAGTYKSETGSAACSECEANTYSDSIAADSSETCTACPSNSNSDAGSATASDCICPAGYGGAECTACAAGTHKSGAGYHDCTSCDTGTYSDAAGQDDCTQCPDNTLSPEQSTDISDCICEAGYTADANGQQCTACPAGTFKENTGTGECQNCDVDTWSSDTQAVSDETCSSCPNNAVSPGGSEQKTDCKCPAGYTGNDGTECLACSAGTYKSTPGSDACTECAEDTFSNDPAAESSSTCTQCNPNSNSEAGSSDIDECVCDAGYYGTGVDERDCESCPADYWCQNGGKNNCPQYSSSSAQSSAVEHCECKPKYVGPHGGPCSSCTADEYCLGGNTSIGCPDNASSPPDSSTKTDCICDGGYQGDAGGPCTLCPENTYCSSGSLSSCPTHARSASGSNELIDCRCKSGYTGENGGSCAKCAANSYCTGGNSQVSCPLHTRSQTGSNSSKACTCKSGWYGTQGGPCTECETGSWCSAGDKYQCPSSSTSAAGASAITNCTCIPGFRGADGTICHACAANVWCFNGERTECSAHSSSPARSSVQTACTCDAGYTGQNGGTCTACSGGTYKDTEGDDGCTSCGVNTYSAETAAIDETTCSSCPSNSVSSEGSDAQIDCTCDAGYTGPDGDTCDACAAGTYKTDIGSAVCTSCPEDTWSDEPHADENTCQNCSPHASSPSGSAAITNCRCNAGYTGADGGTCAACTAGTYKDTKGSATCINCGTSRYGPDNAATEEEQCIDCPENSLSANDSTEQEQCFCKAGYTGNNGGTCTACSKGTYKDTEGDDGCIPSPHNTYVDNSAATSYSNCPDNTVSPEGSDAQIDCICKPGYTGEDGAQCTACPKGTYKEEEGSGVCMECAADTFSATPAASSETYCEDCPANTFSPEGSDDRTDCTCLAGYYATYDGNQCTACPAGTYKESTGAGGFNSCQSCDADTYSENAAADSEELCLACPAYSSSTTGSDEKADCNCWTGYTHVGVEHCNACAEGTYKADTGTGDCTDCEANTWSDSVAASSDSVCTACLLHSASDAGSDEQTDCTCEAGYTGNDGNECTACDAGTYKTDTGDADCTPCQKDYWSDEPHAVDADTCQDCASNTQSPSSSDAKTDCICQKGYRSDDGYSEGDACTACAAGTYKDETGDTTCTPCGEDTYSMQEAADDANTCIHCPIHMHSPSSSTAQSDCTCKKGYSPGGESDFGERTCTACVPGTYKEHIGDNSCTNCEAGTYMNQAPPDGLYVPSSNSTDCEGCPYYTSSPEGSAEITDCTCVPGYYGPSGQECAQCNTAQWCFGGTNYTCPPDSTSAAGSSALSDCVCVSGFHGDPGSDINSTCQRCTADRYCTGGTNNTQCPAFSNAPAGSGLQTDCICDGGYQGDAGGPCTLCPPETYCSSGVLTTCHDHSLAPSGSEQRTDCVCKGGYFGEDGDTCTQCPPDSYCTGGNSKVVCPPNSVSQMGSNTSSDCTCRCAWYGIEGVNCTECEAGAWCHGGARIMCPSNTNSPPASNTVTNCTCIPGFKGPAGTECNPCAADMWCSNGVVHACGANTNAPARSGATTDCICIAGYDGRTIDSNSSSSCTACAAGSYKPNNGSATCTACQNDTYSAEVAATTDTCDACPANSNSEEYSTTVTDCLCQLGYGDPGNYTCLPCAAAFYKDTRSMLPCVSCGFLHSTSRVASQHEADCVCDATHFMGFEAQGCLACRSNSSGHTNMSHWHQCQCEPGFGATPVRLLQRIPADRYGDAMALGVSHTCVVTTDMQVKCWGWNVLKKLGFIEGSGPASVLFEPGDDAPLAISSSFLHSCALIFSFSGAPYGSVTCWGSNLNGRLGQYIDNSGEGQPEELPSIAIINRAVRVVVGYSHTCVIQYTDWDITHLGIRCWGANWAGALGYGDSEDRGGVSGFPPSSLPEVDLGSGVYPVDLALGVYTTCVILDTSDVKCWGRNKL